MEQKNSILKNTGVMRDNIYDLLRKGIVEFDLLPGEIISENSLSTELGVSRSPLRDALSRLVEENCIVVYPQRGTQISLISISRVRQFVFMRTVLEHKIIEELCAKGTKPSQIELLYESLAKQRHYHNEQMTSELLAEDRIMHRMLYEFCGKDSVWNSFHMLSCDTQRIACLRLRTYSYHTTMTAVENWENILIEHKMIIDALHKRDARSACLIINRHISQLIWSCEDLRRIYPQYFDTSEREQEKLNLHFSIAGEFQS